jgi:hypothetical protein
VLSRRPPGSASTLATSCRGIGRHGRSHGGPGEVHECGYSCVLCCWLDDHRHVVVGDATSGGFKLGPVAHPATRAFSLIILGWSAVPLDCDGVLVHRAVSFVHYAVSFTGVRVWIRASGSQRLRRRCRALRPRVASGFLLGSIAPCPGGGKATYVAVPDCVAASDSAGRLAWASRTRFCSDRYSW